MTVLGFSTPGFMEILVLGVLALLIFGPDKLPGMARNAGQMVARFKREAASTLQELKDAADIDELRGVADDLRSTGSELRATGTDLQRAGADLKASTAIGPRTPRRPPGPAPDGPDHAEVVPPFDPDAT